MTESLNRSPSKFSSHLNNNDTEGQLTIAAESTKINKTETSDNSGSSINRLSKLLGDSSIEQNDLEKSMTDGGATMNEDLCEKVQKRELILSVDDIERNNGKHAYRSLNETMEN
ncbi:hypothetical protein QE152_g4301 [Popillia japonica]|uniref:Uncharacterized protein n=1 Tax=Popillia japonica TaxID=7064 RepID=A0AAW1N190_POPJA